MREDKGFLFDKVANCDLVLAEIEGLPRPQSFYARVKRVYSARKGVEVGCVGQQIEFVGGPAHWGQVPLAIGDTALVFLKLVSGRLYEDAWRGHMLVESIDGQLYAIVQHRELWLSMDVPPEIRAVAKQDPTRLYASAVRLDVLERYLRDLIARVDHGAS